MEAKRWQGHGGEEGMAPRPWERSCGREEGGEGRLEVEGEGGVVAGEGREEVGEERGGGGVGVRHEAGSLGHWARRSLMLDS